MSALPPGERSAAPSSERPSENPSETHPDERYVARGIVELLQHAPDPDELVVDLFQKQKRKSDALLWKEAYTYYQRVLDAPGGWNELHVLHDRLVGRLRKLDRHLSQLPDPVPESTLSPDDIKERLHRYARLSDALSQSERHQGDHDDWMADPAARELDAIAHELMTERYARAPERLRGTRRLVRINLSALSYVLRRQEVLLDNTETTHIEELAVQVEADHLERGKRGPYHPEFTAIIYYFLFEDPDGRTASSFAELKRIIQRKGACDFEDDGFRFDLQAADTMVDTVKARTHTNYRNLNKEKRGDFELFRSLVKKTHEERKKNGKYESFRVE